MLKINGLKKSYGDFHLDVSMEVPAGMVVGLVGSNGAGKSTTIKSVLQLIRPDAGSIQFCGNECGAGGSLLTKSEKEMMGVVLSDSGFSAYLTPSDVKSICAAMYSKFDKNKFTALCRDLEIPERKQIRTFSTGMKAKLKVAAALCHDARFLIMDEPTSGLDVIVRDHVLDLLRAYMEEKEDRSILISSHISSDLESICDTLYMIKKGRIVFHEDTDILLSRYGILKCSEDQYNEIDRQYICRRIKESFGYTCLTTEKHFYIENYPKLVIENSGIDDLILLMEKGEDVS